MLQRIFCCAALGFAMIVGCDKKESTPAVPASIDKAASDAKDAASDAADKASDAAGSAVDQAKEAGAAASDAASEAADKAADTVAGAADSASDAAAGAADNAAAAGSDMTAEASKLIEQATTYVKENKWDLAESTVKKLEGMKASLPAEYQPQVDNVRKMLDTAKAAGGVKLPGM
jgi:hypothetical protein